MNKIIQGDCLQKLKELEDNSVDAIITDPPYEIGFMGKGWDNTGIAYNLELWKECLRVLKPGGYLFAFSATKTYHRMAIAIEDAGFEIRDMIEWVYGSGFPKSLNIGKSVNQRPDKDKGTSEWEGWGTALKPSHEPICMAMKPLSEKTIVENCLKWGVGAINIDESRVDVADSEKVKKEGHIRKGNVVGDDRTSVAAGQFGEGAFVAGTDLTNGRWPANLIHDGSEEVEECFPDANGNPSRFFKSIIYTSKTSKSERNKGCDELEYKKQTGSYNFRIDGSLDGKPTLPNKNNHPTVKPLALMEYLIKMVTREGQVVLDPFAGSGSTLCACVNTNRDYIGIELTEDYIPIIEARLEYYKKLKSNKLFN